jgi:checkpoint serine/threonine-protein kinase
LSFEEIWASNRGWLDQTWPDDEIEEVENPSSAVDMLAQTLPEKLVVHSDVVMLDENGAPIYNREAKPKKKKVMEINETQISQSNHEESMPSLQTEAKTNGLAVKAKLDSPSKPKIRKRSMAEPTMTLHTRAATDDIYDIFNQPLKQDPLVEESADDYDYETDDYTSGAESTKNMSTSEAGDEEAEDEEEGDAVGEDEISDVKSVSEWSDFTARKHIPDMLSDDEANDNTQSSDVIEVIDVVASAPESDQVIPEEEEEVVTPVTEAFLPKTRTSFIPIPPEDYVPPTRPYRDPVEMANNRLPFMTPITERTESSLDMDSVDNMHAKTPSRTDGKMMSTVSVEEEDSIDLEPLSSPLRDVVNDDLPKGKLAQPLLQRSQPAAGKPLLASKAPPKGPIIKDLQCNPVDDGIRDEILANIHPPLSSYEGFFDHRGEKYEKGGDIRKFAKAVSKVGRTSVDKTGILSTSVVIQFPDVSTQYSIKKELGAGAFAPVYLVENLSQSASEEDDELPVAVMGKGAFASPHQQRSALEALKMEAPPTPWEFHMMRTAHSRLGPQHRATASLCPALELHLYDDEGFLFLPYRPHGTLLDVVNLFRGAADGGGAMDELLAMFFAAELLRTVEALHAKQVLHGDIKVDNCLLRLDGAADLAAQYSASGAGGWASRGVLLIDFGRAIDMRNFVPDAQFIADWKTSAQDCAEMREGRPWTWQIDYHGLAGTLHCLLFGRYIETARCDGGGGLSAAPGGRRYKIRENLKRYWQTEIWAECFDLLLNPGAHVEAEEGARMPVLKSMRNVREKMEAWLEANSEKGVGLRSLMAKVEAWARGRK